MTVHSVFMRSLGGSSYFHICFTSCYRLSGVLCTRTGLQIERLLAYSIINLPSLAFLWKNVSNVMCQKIALVCYLVTIQILTKDAMPTALMNSSYSPAMPSARYSRFQPVLFHRGQAHAPGDERSPGSQWAPFFRHYAESPREQEAAGTASGPWVPATPPWLCAYPQNSCWPRAGSGESVHHAHECWSRWAESEK